MSHKPGEIITLRSDRHYVYALIDDEDQVFYVGRTVAPRARLQQHVQCGVARVAERLKQVAEPRMRILAGPVSDIVAREIEHLCIRVGEDFCELANREAHPGVYDRCEAVLRFARGKSDNT